MTALKMKVQPALFSSVEKKSGSSLCLQRPRPEKARWRAKERCKENKLCQSAFKIALQIISSQNTAEKTTWQIIGRRENILVVWKHSEDVCGFSHQVYYMLKEFLTHTHTHTSTRWGLFLLQHIYQGMSNWMALEQQMNKQMSEYENDLATCGVIPT